MKTQERVERTSCHSATLAFAVLAHLGVLVCVEGGDRPPNLVVAIIASKNLDDGPLERSPTPHELNRGLGLELKF